MSGSATDDPSLLLEASRVFNAAGKDYRPIAEVLSEAAVRLKLDDTPVSSALLCDAAALRLSGRLPGGWRRALELLARVHDGTSEDGDTRKHLLQALALGQQYRDVKKADNKDETLPALLSQVTASVQKATAQYNRATPPGIDPKPLDAEHFWNPKSPLRRAIALQATDKEDDLMDAAQDSKELIDLLRTGVPPKPAGTVKQTGITGTQPADFKVLD